jgi:LAGLIDADG DNA endonuclease family
LDLAFIILFVYSLVVQTIRSTKGVKRLSSSERTLIILPDKVKEILVGILLGDAHIVQRSSITNSRLVYAQTAVTHKEYFNYMLSFFLPFCAKGYIPQSRIVRDNRTIKLLLSLLIYRRYNSILI